MSAPAKSLAGIAIILLIAAGIWFYLSPAGIVTYSARESKDVDLAVGQNLYARECASCHGAKLEGQPNWQSRLPNGRLPAPPHDTSGHTWHHSDQQLFEITKYGVEKFAGPGYLTDMPKFEGKLSDDQIWSVLGYVKSTWPDRERAAQARMSAQPVQ